ncbi:MAG: zinc ribbon domain-containing protein [Turicibacter sp.]|nr:zinc ribbon domain-containing protein [Turicibacter sp.]
MTFCVNCGVQNADNMKICGGCGAATSTATATISTPARVAPAKSPINRLLFVVPIALVMMILVGCNSHGLNGVWVHNTSGNFFAEVEFRRNTVIMRNHNFTLSDGMGWPIIFAFHPTQTDLDNRDFGVTNRAYRLTLNEVVWSEQSQGYTVRVSAEREGTFSVSGDNRMEILWSDGQHEEVIFRVAENNLAPNQLQWQGRTYTFERR